MREQEKILNLKNQFNQALGGFKGLKDMLKDNYDETPAESEAQPSSTRKGPSPIVPEEIHQKKETALSFHKESKCGKRGPEARPGFATGKKGAGSSIGSYLKKMLRPQD